MADILHRVGVRATPEAVYKAIADIQGLRKWWTTDIKASPDNKKDIRFRFGNKGFFVMRVIRSHPGKSIQWRCVDGPREWVGTRLTFNLKKEGKTAVVLFSHRGWSKQVEFMHHCSTKWAVFLLSLRASVESGRGRPFPRDLKIDNWN